MVLSLVLSGGFAGLAGGIQVLGVRHRMSAEGGAIAFTGNAGFNGIVAALFGKLHPLGTIPRRFCSARCWSAGTSSSARCRFRQR